MTKRASETVQTIGSYSLSRVHPDGSELVEHFDDSATLAKRQSELESTLSHDGWTGPFGRTI